MQLKLINLTSVNKLDQLKLLKIRNESSIRNNMFSKEVISPNRHLEWISELSKSKLNKVFCVYSNNKVIGSMGYSLIESIDKSCSWSFYLSQKSRSFGLAPYLEMNFLDYLFFKKNLNIIYADILDSNRLIFNLHKKFGFEVTTQQENSSSLSNDNCRIKLSIKTWEIQRVTLNKKFSSIFNKFTINIIES